MITMKGFLFVFTRIVIKLINGYAVIALVNKLISMNKRIKIILWTSNNFKSLQKGNNRNIMINIKMKHSISKGL